MSQDYKPGKFQDGFILPEKEFSESMILVGSPLLRLLFLVGLGLVHLRFFTVPVGGERVQLRAYYLRTPGRTNRIKIRRSENTFIRHASSRYIIVS